MNDLENAIGSILESLEDLAAIMSRKTISKVLHDEARSEIQVYLRLIGFAGEFGTSLRMSTFDREREGKRVAKRIKEYVAKPKVLEAALNEFGESSKEWQSLVRIQQAADYIINLD